MNFLMNLTFYECVCEKQREAHCSSVFSADEHFMLICALKVLLLLLLACIN